MDTQDIWKLHADDIKYFILSKVKDEVIADDLLQETFIKVHTKLNTLKDEDKLKSWLFSIARYTVLDYFRSKKLVYETTDEDFIFEELHLPLPTIKSQIQRGRKMIAQGFVDCCDFVVNDAGFLVGEVKDKADCKMCH